jgi:Fur family transcriptional regulator, ferric uptake regulator
VRRKNPAPDLDAIRKTIRDAGLRSTHARVAVLNRLQATEGPLTHAEIADELAPFGYDRATIYRNLVELAEAGLLSRMELGDHVWRFELRRDSEDHEADHTHFLCVDCGGVSCITGLALKTAVSLVGKRTTVGEVTEVLLKGHCKRCQ